MADGGGIAAALRLAAIFDWSRDAIVGQDLTGVIRSWNRGAEQMLGHSESEAVGQSIALVTPGDRRSQEEDVLRRILMGEAVDHFETVWRCKNGTHLPVLLTISPIRGPDGVVIGLSKVARDIRERRQAEALVRDLERRLLALVAGSGALLGSPRLESVLPATVNLASDLLTADGYAIWRPDRGLKAWKIVASSGMSDAFTAGLVGADEDVIKALSSTDPLIVENVHEVPSLAGRLHAYRQEAIQSLLMVPLAIGATVSGAVVAYYRSRRQFSDLEVSTARALGNLAAAAITTAELYEDQRRVRQNIEHANRRTAFLAEASTVLASSLDYETTLGAVANLAVPHMADWCAVDIINERGAIERVAVAHINPAKAEYVRTLQAKYPEDPESPYSIAQVIKRGRPVILENVADMRRIPNRTRDEERRKILTELGLTSYISVPLVARGRTLGALTFVAAESGRRYTEEDLRFAGDLAYRAALAVDNAHAYRQASAANRAKDEFLATLSHELRTPLNAVLGWARMLREGEVREDRRSHALDVIERNAVAQLRLVEDLLDVSRIITGKFRLDVQQVELSSTIEASLEAVQPAADAKSIRLQKVLDPNASPVYGDAARLQQAVWNLLANAVKFTPRGGRVQVALLRSGSHVEIEVTDTGEGLAADVLPFVFDRFRQGDSGPARGHMGLGLGLAIVRHIVELHGGSVSAASEGEGAGATFKVALPVIAADRLRESNAARVHPSLGGFGTPIDLNPMLRDVKVLVIEDDADARELIVRLLSGRHARVTAVESAAAAWASLDEALPDVILSDIEMPKQDGYEFIRLLRQRQPDRGGAVAAIALTAYARPEDRARSLMSGFQVHLSKPVDFDELLAAVASLGGKANQRPSLSKSPDL